MYNNNATHASPEKLPPPMPLNARLRDLLGTLVTCSVNQSEIRDKLFGPIPNAAGQSEGKDSREYIPLEELLGRVEMVARECTDDARSIAERL